MAKTFKTLFREYERKIWVWQIFKHDNDLEFIVLVSHESITLVCKRLKFLARYYRETKELWIICKYDNNVKKVQEIFALYIDTYINF